MSFLYIFNFKVVLLFLKLKLIRYVLWDGVVFKLREKNLNYEKKNVNKSFLHAKPTFFSESVNQTVKNYKMLN